LVKRGLGKVIRIFHSVTLAHFDRFEPSCIE
jgi:hypothetical protein